MKCLYMSLMQPTKRKLEIYYADADYVLNGENKLSIEIPVFIIRKTTSKCL